MNYKVVGLVSPGRASLQSVLVCNEEKMHETEQTLILIHKEIFGTLKGCDIDFYPAITHFVSAFGKARFGKIKARPVVYLEFNSMEEKHHITSLVKAILSRTNLNVKPLPDIVRVYRNQHPERKSQ